jgi:hypothetical protein
MSRSHRIGSCILAASLLAIAVLSTGCPVAPIVRVSRDVGGGANRNLDLTSHFS